MFGKLLNLGVFLLLLTGCSNSETHTVQKEGENSNYQWIEEIATSVTKHYSKNTGKLIYIYSGSGSGSAMIDSEEEPIISKDFLERIEIVELEKPKTTTVIFRDKDNGNILVLTKGWQDGTIEVQKPNSDVLR